MGFGVFIHRSDSIYEDSPAERYQFPGQYLDRVKACIGDWIIYYEPRKAQESRGYFAIAKIQQVIPDQSTPGMYVAIIEPNSYLDFVNAVPFRDAEGLVERGLLNDEGKKNSLTRSIRRSTDFSGRLHSDHRVRPRRGQRFVATRRCASFAGPARATIRLPVRAGTKPRRLFNFPHRARQHLSPRRPPCLRLPLGDHFAKV